MHKGNKVALVTGAGHGIGRVVALGMARVGFSVGVHYAESKAAAMDVAAEIEQACGTAHPHTGGYQTGP